jgi:hypothetical protein
MTGAVIKHVQVAAAHDGVAELIVTLEFETGGQSLVTLDEHAAQKLIESTGVDSAEDLAGQGWEHVRDALASSSARYLNQKFSDQREIPNV